MSGCSGSFKLLRKIVVVTYGIALALMAGCSSSELSSAEYVELAKSHMDKNELQASVIELKNALRQEPENIAARLLLGQVYLRFGDGAAAEQTFQRAISLGGSSDNTTLLLAHALLLQGRYKDIILKARVSPNISNEIRASMHFIRGRAYIGLDDLPNASKEFQSALDIAPDFEDTWLGQAWQAYYEGRWEDAGSWLSKVLKANPNHIEGQALSGDLAMAQEDYTSAETIYKRILDARPNNLMYMLALTNAQLKLGKNDNAITHLTKVLKVIPQHAGVNRLRAIAAFQKQDFENAKVYAEKVFNSSENDTYLALSARLIAGFSSYYLGLYEQANVHLTRFIQSVPNYDPAIKLLAATQLQLNSPQKGVTLLKNASLKTDEDVALFTAAGNAALQTGDFFGSRNIFQRLNHFKPDDSSIQTQLGFIEVALGEEEEGLGDLQKAIELDKDHANAAGELADFLNILNHIRSNEYDKALEAALAFQRERPDNAYGYTLAGVVYAVTMQEQKAKAAFSKALELKPGEPNAASNLAAYAMRDKEFERARELYRQILDHDSAHLKTLLNLAELEIRQGNEQQALGYLEDAVAHQPDNLEASVQLGRLYMRNNSLDKALSTARSALVKNPDSPALLEIAAAAYLKMGDTNSSVEKLLKLIELQPEIANHRIALAFAYDNLGNIEQASHELQVALELDPTNARARFHQAQLFVQLGQLDSAKQLLGVLKSEVPEDPSILELEGKIALTENRYKDAVDLFTSALQKRQNNFLTIQLSTAQFLAGDHEASLTTLENWLVQYPDDVLARNTFADRLLTMRRFDEAKKQYREIVTRGPDNNAAVHNNLAWILLHQKDPDPEAAYRSVQRALELAPQQPNIMATLGEILLAQGKLGEAESVLRQASKLAPTNSSIAFYLAQVLVQNGESENEARKILTELMARKQPFAQQEAAAALLKKISN